MRIRGKKVLDKPKWAEEFKKICYLLSESMWCFYGTFGCTGNTERLIHCIKEDVITKVSLLILFEQEAG